MTTNLRDRIAAALLARIKQAVFIEPEPFSGAVGQLLAATEYDLADAVLAELATPRQDGERLTINTLTSDALDRLVAERDLYRDFIADAQRKMCDAHTEADRAKAEASRLRDQLSDAIGERDRARAALSDATTDRDRIARELATMTEVARGNKQHVQRITPDLVHAEAAIDRVRAALHIADDEDVTDWQRGYRDCAEHALAALEAPPDVVVTITADPTAIQAALARVARIPTVPCAAAVLPGRYSHDRHLWEPQPGMPPVRCPGRTTDGAPSTTGATT